MTRSLPPIPFEGLSSADLSVGRVYRGGPQPHVGADPLHKLTGVGNSGGFRIKSVKRSKKVALCVLFSTGAVSEWPDHWTKDGNYVYYGDQRQAGMDVLDTPRKGNQLLADVAAHVKRGASGRRNVPPFLLFKKVGQGKGRDVRFEGLLVPAPGSKWLDVHRQKHRDGVLSNYRALLRPLPVTEISRSWLADLTHGYGHGSSAPQAWVNWVSTGDIG